MFKKLFKKKPTDLAAPMSGKMISLDKVNDPVFQSRAMGDGFAIEFKSGNVYSPVDGEVVSIFPTNHAIGIKSHDYNEILIHLGLDTVNLKGKGFKSTIKKGDKVKKHDLLVEVDHDLLKSENVDMTSPIIILNMRGRAIELLKEGEDLEVGMEEIIRLYFPKG